jgi:hypothetical protein
MNIEYHLPPTKIAADKQKCKDVKLAVPSKIKVCEPEKMLR